MKNNTQLKAIVLSLLMLIGFIPLTSFAQSDWFIFNEDGFFGRDAWAFTVNTQDFGATPVGSGLLILGIAGAGYAVAKRRRSKHNINKDIMMMLAGLILLGTIGCKKKSVKPIVNAEGKVYITVRVKGGNRADVNPENGHITFNEGDLLYVGNNGNWIGTLTYSNGAFSSYIETDGTSTDDYLHFYLLGGKQDPNVLSTTQLSVVITDQTSSYPVISYGMSTEKYHGEAAYETTLENKCSLVKFSVDTPSDMPINIIGMKNKVTVDISNNTIVYDQDGEGKIRMRPKNASNETWAIVLPQDALAAGADGTAFTVGYTGCRPALPAIGLNEYIGNSTAVAMAVKTVGTSRTLDLSTITDHTTVEDCWTMTGTLGGNYKISIADGATVTLNGVTINGVDEDSCPWEGLNCLGDATLILADGTTNTVKGFYRGYAGIHVNSTNTLTIQGTGALNASSHGGGAGIGGNDAGACGHIIINGGTITAICDDTFTPAAGIGCAVTGNCMGITINGGTVTATGAHDAAGIGCANGSSNGQSICYSITINGGTVTAIGGSSAAGIGSSVSSEGDILASACNSITITGGTITARGGSGAAGIGSGVINSTCGNITITGGTINAIGGDGDGGFGGAGIGTGNASTCGNITIDNAVTLVTATKGSGAINSIGIGSNSEFYPESPAACGTVTIGGTVYWDGSNYQNGGDSYLTTGTLVYPAP